MSTGRMANDDELKLFGKLHTEIVSIHAKDQSEAEDKLNYIIDEIPTCWMVTYDLVSTSNTLDQHE